MLSRLAVFPTTNNLLAIIYFLVGLTGIATLAVEVPPFQNPDEPAHFLRAEQLSRLVLIGQRIGPRSAGGEADPGILRAAVPFLTLPFNSDHKVTRPMYADAAPVRWGDRLVLTDFPNTVVYPAFFYLPAVCAIWTGKLLQIPVVETLYLARAMTGAAAVTIGAAAVALAGTAAPWLFVILSLPMVFSLMAAASQDGLMIPVAALAVALLSGGIQRTGPVALGRFLAACLCLVLVGMARPPNAALALVLLLPRGPGLPLRLAGVAGVVASVAAWTGLAALTAVASFRPDVTPEHAPDPGAQLAFIVGDPIGFLMALGRTLQISATAFIRQGVGQLGWLDVTMPEWLHHLAWAALGVAALLCARTGMALRRRLLVAAVSGAAIVLAAIGLFAVQYLTWTPVGAPAIQGVQGRYFLPPLLFAAGLLAIEPPPAGLPGRALRFGLSAALALFPVVVCTATIRAIVTRYYL
jgi:hypothetical protein